MKKILAENFERYFELGMINKIQKYKTSNNIRKHISANDKIHVN